MRCSCGRTTPNSWQTTRKRSSRLRVHRLNRLRAKTPAAGGEPASKPPAPPAAPAAPAAKPPAAPGAPAAQNLRLRRVRLAPPAPPKEGPVALDNDLVKRYKEKFGPAILEAWTDRKQAILVVARELLAEIAIYSRDDEKFDWLSDLTAVDWPKREKRFDIVLNMYSFEKNERLRLKVHASGRRARAQRAGNLVHGKLDGARSVRHVRRGL